MFRTSMKEGKSEKQKPMESMTKVKDRTKHSKGSGMETEQAEQLDALLNQSDKVLNN